MGFERFIHFDAEELDDFIEESGVSVSVLSAVRCACASEASEQPNPMCPKCNGFGWVYDSLPAVQTKALMTADEFRKEYKIPGAHEHGSISCTLKSGVSVSDMDKILPEMERMTINDDILTCGARSVSIPSVSLEMLRATYPETIYVLRGRSIIYSEGVDFEVSSVDRRTILWLPGGRKPIDGERYSVRYSARSEYVVFETQPRVREDCEKLPTFCKLMKLDAYWRNRAVRGADSDMGTVTV